MTDLSLPTTWHREAMDLLDQALLARLQGNAQLAHDLTEQAFEKECQAAHSIPADLHLEPTRSVLHRGAATLALQCGQIQAAKQLVQTGLAGHPPDDILLELQDLQQQIQNREVLKAPVSYDFGAHTYHVFISYRSVDRDWVKTELLPRIENAGLTVCIDYRDFTPGKPTVQNIEEAIYNSRKTLLVFTPSYLTSEWTALENLLLQSQDPVNRNLQLIPVMKEKCALPPRLKMLTYLNFADPDDIEAEWIRLLKALR